MIRKCLGVLLVLVAIMGVNSAYGDSVNVSVNGEKVIFDVSPVIDDGRTLVPLRAIFEKLDADIAWDAETRTITAIKDKMEVVLQIGNADAYVNGEKILMDVPAKIINGRTLVPVRFVSESMGSVVGWDGASKTVLIKEATVFRKDLRSDQIWTKEQGPYILTDNFVVPKGNTVTIEEGAEVHLRTDEINVSGKLIISGSSLNKVKLIDESPSKNAKIFIKAEGSELVNVESRISVQLIKSSNTILSNSSFKSIELEASNQVAVTNCVINGGEYGVRGFQSNELIIKGNEISDCQNGILLKLCKDSKVLSNTIRMCSYGVVSNTNYNSQFLENNLSNCKEYGLFIENASYGNEYYYNNLYENTLNAKVDIGERTINMFDNYWGVHKVELVADTIEDYKDNHEYTEVLYEPILNEPYTK